MIVTHAPAPGSATIAPTATPATPTPPAPDLDALRTQFLTLAGDLEKSDATLTTMVTDRSLVGDAWSSHLTSLAERLQGARDAFRIARPEEGKVSAALGADVLGLAEAAGSLAVMSRQRLTLAEGWTSFLDAAIADARSAADLLPAPKPAEPTPAKPAPAQPVQPPKATKPSA